jgi:hypothetical protein
MIFVTNVEGVNQCQLHVICRNLFLLSQSRNIVKPKIKKCTKMMRNTEHSGLLYLLKLCDIACHVSLIELLKRM